MLPLLTALGTTLVSANVFLARQLIVVPAGGQTAEQPSIGDAECRAWVPHQIGFNAATAPPPNVATVSASRGQVVRGAAQGALLGVVGGAIAGDVGKGAAIGAGVGATGGLFNRMGAQRQHQQVQQQAQATYQAQWSQFNRAVAKCLTGRGYTVS